MLNKHQPNGTRKRFGVFFPFYSIQLISTYFYLFLLIFLTIFTHFYLFLLMFTYVISYISSIKLLDLPNLNSSTKQSASSDHRWWIWPCQDEPSKMAHVSNTQAELVREHTSSYGFNISYHSMNCNIVKLAKENWMSKVPPFPSLVALSMALAYIFIWEMKVYQEVPIGLWNVQLGQDRISLTLAPALPLLPPSAPELKVSKSIDFAWAKMRAENLPWPSESLAQQVFI